MKVLKRLLIAATSLICFAGCTSNLPEDTGISNYSASRAVVPEASRTTNITVYVLGADTKYNWNLWAWAENGNNDLNYDKNGWPGGDYPLTKATDVGNALSVNILVDPNYAFGLLFVAKGGSPQTGDVMVSKDKLKQGAKLYFIYGRDEIYDTPEDAFGIQSMVLNNNDGTELNALVIGYTNLNPEDFVITDKDENVLPVTDVSELSSSYHMTITLEGGSLSKLPYTVVFKGDTENPFTISFTPDLIDVVGFKYDGDDLGVTVKDGKATFKTWSPLAEEVKVLIFEKPTSSLAKDTLVMNFDSATGVWSYEDYEYGTYKYYKYNFRFANNVYKTVSDIWSYSASVDSVASQITDINEDSNAKPEGWETSYTNPFGNSGNEAKSYSDAVIFEMHVRDWAKAWDGSGKFIELAHNEEFINHLKDLGVTHVQILPAFDYAEKNSNTSYNWGYNPYHYNVPEGRYVTDMTDGTDAVRQFRELILALHNAGIAVNMDVVYNHTSATGDNSLYDKTVPKYFYRLVDGKYSNGSGCGNEIASNHYMVRKYIIDSLVHWMKDYHINGFRFDLMGCLEKSTMAEIYEALYKVDPNVMVYGEPWTGGTAAVVDGADKSGATITGWGYGAFDDGFRDAIKGAEFGGFKPGQVQGTFADAKIINGLLGKSTRNDSGKTALQINYAECHDNYTLFDKLAMCYASLTNEAKGSDLFEKIGASGLNAVKAQNKLAAAYVLLAQGTPFINGGQEFLRTKKGDENSYSSTDEINAIDFSFKYKYNDVYEVYRALINLRKDYSAFTKPASAEASKLANGVTYYKVSSSTDTFEVVYNATDSAYSLANAIDGYVVTAGSKLNVAGSYAGLVYNDASAKGTSYTIADKKSSTTSVPAKSFVIIKK